MSVLIQINPVWAADSQTQTTTSLQVTIDLSNIQRFLDKYNILVQAMVKTSLENPDTGITEVREYPHTVLVDNLEMKSYRYETIVLGHIKDKSQLQVSAMGYYVKKY